MKIIVVCGFLNAGKTTLTAHLIKYITEKCVNKRIIYIQNEFGKTQIGKSDNVEIKELLTGCVCCSTSADMLKLLSEITSSDKPDWVIMETNGISIPQNIKELLFGRLGLKCKTIFIAEAQRWFRLKKATANISSSQVKGSDIAIVNKCDLADEDIAESVKSDILDLNNSIDIYTCTALNGLSEEIYNAVLGI